MGEGVDDYRRNICDYKKMERIEINGRWFADYNFYFYILFRIWAFFPCCEQKLDIIKFV